MLKQGFDIDAIKSLLPHREPFLFADTAQTNADLTAITTSRRFLADEPYFPGHFPGDPIVPGVLLIESIAQSAHLLMCRRAGTSLPGYLVGIEAAAFNDFVHPPATVAFETTLVRELMRIEGARPGRIYVFKSQGRVIGKRCVRGAVNIFVGDVPAAPDQ